MAFVTKTWKDRMVEFAGRRKLKNVSTNEAVLYDVSRSEGTVMQAGDSFSATNMNDLEQRIKTEFDNVNSSLGGMKFYEDENGNKYVVGADSVPKKLGECDFKIKIRAAYGGTSDDGLYDKEFTYKNGTWTSKDIQKDNGRGTIQGWLYVSVLSFEML